LVEIRCSTMVPYNTQTFATAVQTLQMKLLHPFHIRSKFPASKDQGSTTSTRRAAQLYHKVLSRHYAFIISLWPCKLLRCLPAVSHKLHIVDTLGCHCSFCDNLANVIPVLEVDGGVCSRTVKR